MKTSKNWEDTIENTNELEGPLEDTAQIGKKINFKK